MGHSLPYNPIAATLPAWVRGFGSDQYGHWVTFGIGEVIQRLRWIMPGAFLMGSPAWEQDREKLEGPQHLVTFSQGFWMFDTACTQALWQAVMGSNPSRFQGVNLPVEQVSWDDCQDFIKQLNERLPGLDLALPTEAQWEYACRAGTTTPFSFGDNITLEQVNYNGNYPYADGQWDVYRGRTVPVKSLPPNPWGLYEMHGNIWEWTQDYWHDSFRGALTSLNWEHPDGSAWIDATGHERRVVRGGSWRTRAQSVRAGFRHGLNTGDRTDTLGFRCVR